MLEINTAFVDHISPEHSNLPHRLEVTIFIGRKTVKKKNGRPQRAFDPGICGGGTLVLIQFSSTCAPKERPIATLSPGIEPRRMSQVRRRTGKALASAMYTALGEVFRNSDIPFFHSTRHCGGATIKQKVATSLED